MRSLSQQQECRSDSPSAGDVNCSSTIHSLEIGGQSVMISTGGMSFNQSTSNHLSPTMQQAESMNISPRPEETSPREMDQ